MAVMHRTGPGEVGQGERVRWRGIAAGTGRGTKLRAAVSSQPSVGLAATRHRVEHDGELPFGQHAGRTRQTRAEACRPVLRDGWPSGGDRSPPAIMRAVVVRCRPLAQDAGGVLPAVEGSRLVRTVRPFLHGGFLGAEAGDEIAPHILGEIGVDLFETGARTKSGANDRALPCRRQPGRAVITPLIDHAVEHPVAPGAGGGGPAVRIIIVRRLGQARRGRRRRPGVSSSSVLPK